MRRDTLERVRDLEVDALVLGVGDDLVHAVEHPAHLRFPLAVQHEVVEVGQVRGLQLAARPARAQGYGAATGAVSLIGGLVDRAVGSCHSLLPSQRIGGGCRTLTPAFSSAEPTGLSHLRDPQESGNDIIDRMFYCS